MSKRGRKPTYAKDRKGDPVVGLSVERKSGRHYITGTKIYLGRDFDIALMKFRRWQAEQRKDAFVPVRAGPTPRVKLPIEHNGPVLQPSLYPDRPARTVVSEVPEDWRTAEPGTYDLVSEDAFFAKVRQLILTKPTFVAERTGIAQLACLADLKQPEKSLDAAAHKVATTTRDVNLIVTDSIQPIRAMSRQEPHKTGNRRAWAVQGEKPSRDISDRRAMTKIRLHQDFDRTLPHRRFDLTLFGNT